MSEIKMSKKDSNNLLKPVTAVENFLDTLLQDSTEKQPAAKPVKSKPNLLLIPDLEIEPSPPEVKIEQDLQQHQKILVDTGDQLKQQDDKAKPLNSHENYVFPLQCLMFSVAGAQLSIPLINMGSVLPWGERLTLLPDSPDWFLGIFQHRDINVKVADTAKIIQIGKNIEPHSNSGHILVFGDDNWAITCDGLGDVIKLNEDDVKWSKQGSKGLSLGTIKQSLAILLDPEKILKQLNVHDEKRNIE